MMIQAFVTSILTLYFAFFLGVSGLAKIDRPLVQPGGQGFLLRLKGLMFSPFAGRLLGAFEIVLSFLLAFGIRTEFVTIVNAALFGLFSFFKLALMLSRQGSRCGCFGAHELIASDLPSVIASTVVLGLAVILALSAQWSSPNALSWTVTIIFLVAYGWLVFKTLERRRLEDDLIRRMTTDIVTQKELLPQ